jgi:uncharacterized protein YbaA (DUF1428 family)
MTYVDGFVIPVPEGKLEHYKKMAAHAGKLWMEHGAIGFKECVIDDGEPGPCPEGITLVRFKDMAGCKPGELVIFSFILFNSREERNAVNEKVINDPRMAEGCGGPDFEMPFDPARMAYGGFKAIVDL